MNDFIRFTRLLSIGKDRSKSNESSVKDAPPFASSEVPRLSTDRWKCANTTTEDFVISFRSNDFKGDGLIELSNFIGHETKSNSNFSFSWNNPTESDQSKAMKFEVMRVTKQRNRSTLALISPHSIHSLHLVHRMNAVSVIFLHIEFLLQREWMICLRYYLQVHHLLFVSVEQLIHDHLKTSIDQMSTFNPRNERGALPRLRRPLPPVSFPSPSSPVPGGSGVLPSLYFPSSGKRFLGRQNEMKHSKISLWR